MQFLQFVKIYIRKFIVGRILIVVLILCGWSVDSLCNRALVFHIFYHLFQTLCEFDEVLLVEENFVFVIRESAISLYLSLALCYGKVIIVTFSCLNIKEIGSFSRSYRL